jgi:hypothetical protein
MQVLNGVTLSSFAATRRRNSADGTLAVIAPDVVASAYTQSFARAPSTRLLAIDAATGTLQLQHPPNDGVLTTIGRLDLALVFGPAGMAPLRGLAIRLQ